jgi:hypothetical protein
MTTIATDSDYQRFLDIRRGLEDGASAKDRAKALKALSPFIQRCEQLQKYQRQFQKLCDLNHRLVLSVSYEEFKLFGLEYPRTVHQAARITVEAVKEAYRDLAKKHHPDRGGDAKKFAAITNAYKAITAAISGVEFKDDDPIFDEGNLT